MTKSSLSSGGILVFTIIVDQMHRLNWGELVIEVKDLIDLSGIKSKTTIYKHLNELETKKFIRRPDINTFALVYPKDSHIEYL